MNFYGWHTWFSKLWFRSRTVVYILKKNKQTRMFVLRRKLNSKPSDVRHIGMHTLMEVNVFWKMRGLWWICIHRVIKLVSCIIIKCRRLKYKYFKQLRRNVQQNVILTTVTKESVRKKREHENILFLLSELKILAGVFGNSGSERNNSREGVMGWNDGIYSPLWRGRAAAPPRAITAHNYKGNINDGRMK